MSWREWIRIDAVEYAERCRRAHKADIERRRVDDATSALARLNDLGIKQDRSVRLTEGLLD
jgi:hypothetical protein